MYLLGAIEDVIVSMRDFFQLVFVEIADLPFWPFLMLGIMLCAIAVMGLLIGLSYENKILRSVNRLNSYFLAKPFITEENLVEFNLKMKKVPKVLRNNWQIYMLNREDSPTTYINTSTCIDKPLRTSSIEKNMSNFTIFTIFLALVSLFIGLQYAQLDSATNANVGSILFYAGLVPLGIILFYVIAIFIAKAVKDDIYSSLYDNFPLYERNLTKAVSTLPSYVDYEILFTRKEIKEGIPILQQYLEKRALVEQQELERARQDSQATEEYDFAELGIDGSLILERAMKECETFIRTRNRLQEECGQIEAEKENYKKTYENNEKDYQRKLQASRENLESLKAQQEASTNRIESNYIRKQQSDEIKKQEQLEKDQEEANEKFKEEQINLQQEVDKRKQEIEDKRTFVEQAMLLEFKHYANTLYKALTQKATEIGNQKLITLAQENSDLKSMIADMQGNGMQYYDPTMGMIQNQEVTAENLYDMTSNEMAQLEENRNSGNQMSPEEEALLASADNMVMQDGTQNGFVDPNSVVDSNNGVTDIDPNALGGDGGQQMQNVEDINAIQQQIEAENNKLQQQKQELENDINNINTQMNVAGVAQPQEVYLDPVTSQPQEQVVQQPQVQVVEPIQPEQPALIQQAQPQTPAPQPVEENYDNQLEQLEKTASSTRGRRTSNASSSPRTSARGAKTKRAGRNTTRSNSEIDALNAEMQKLLDSTKN